MKFKPNILSFSISAALLTLAGCSVTSQDLGSGDAGNNAVSGVAVDGYVARAVVYVDTNENNKLDVWETRALTDGRGYFTYSPSYADKNGNTIAAIKYCDLSKDDAKYVHCLKIPTGYDEVLLRMTKGYDLTTVEPFSGTISMRVSSNSDTIENFMVATPVTGLLAEMTSIQKTDFYSNESTLDTTFSSKDFLDFDTLDLVTEEQRLVLLNLALKIHKIADAIAGYLDAQLAQGTDSSLFGEKEGIPTDASIYVYRAIAGEISASQGVSSFLIDEGVVKSIVSKSWINMKAVVNDYNVANPDDKYVIPADPDFNDIAANIVSLASTISTVFSTALAPEAFTDSNGKEQNYTLADDARARIRAIDIMAFLIRSDAATAAIVNAQSLVGDAAYMTNLKSAKVDMTGLKKKFTANVGLVDADAANYDDRQSFATLLADSSLASGLVGANGGPANELGFANNSMEISDDGDSTKIAFMGDTPNATSGTMTIGATFTEGDFAKKDENGNPVPLALEGTWEQLDEYTMLMNIEVAGVIEPVIVKPTLSDDGKTAYYFDLGGEQQIWVP